MHTWEHTPKRRRSRHRIVYSIIHLYMGWLVFMIRNIQPQNHLPSRPSKQISVCIHRYAQLSMLLLGEISAILGRGRGLQAQSPRYMFTTLYDNSINQAIVTVRTLHSLEKDFTRPIATSLLAKNPYHQLQRFFVLRGDKISSSMILGQSYNRK